MIHHIVPGSAEWNVPATNRPFPGSFCTAVDAADRPAQTAVEVALGPGVGDVMAFGDELASEIALLPADLREEVADFVAFIKQRHLGGPANLKASRSPVAPLPATAPSELYLALEAAGLVGCIDTNDQAASHYKAMIDFSGKAGRGS